MHGLRNDAVIVVGPQTRITPWMPTITQARDAMLDRQIIAADYSALPLSSEAKEHVPTRREIAQVSQLGGEAINAGRLIDFGYLPNDVVIISAKRGGPMWNVGALGMPFSEPWIIYHRWEEAVTLYLVNPVDNGCEVVELQPARFNDDQVLGIGDRGLVRRCPQEPEKYEFVVSPMPLRFWADPALAARANKDKPPAAAAAGNIGDPVMTALLILNTRNIERETVQAPEKLQRARMKNGKLPIPAYDRINTAPYVTAIQARGSRPDYDHKAGGTHASPVAHIRMGHPRHYASGRSVFIKDTLVNVPPEQRMQFKSQRSHYMLK